ENNTVGYGVSPIELSKFHDDLAITATLEVLPYGGWFHMVEELAHIKDEEGLQALLKEYKNCFTHLTNYPIKTMDIIRGESEEASRYFI
ncbi:hypothetical protein TorRG33x02_026740, partial [Trema orientale]